MWDQDQTTKIADFISELRDATIQLSFDFPTADNLI